MATPILAWAGSPKLQMLKPNEFGVLDESISSSLLEVRYRNRPLGLRSDAVIDLETPAKSDAVSGGFGAHHCVEWQWQAWIRRISGVVALALMLLTAMPVLSPAIAQGRRPPVGRLPRPNLRPVTPAPQRTSISKIAKPKQSQKGRPNSRLVTPSQQKTPMFLAGKGQSKLNATAKKVKKRIGIPVHTYHRGYYGSDGSRLAQSRRKHLDRVAKSFERASFAIECRRMMASGVGRADALNRARELTRGRSRKVKHALYVSHNIRLIRSAVYLYNKGRLRLMELAPSGGIRPFRTGFNPRTGRFRSTGSQFLNAEKRWIHWLKNKPYAPATNTHRTPKRYTVRDLQHQVKLMQQKHRKLRSQTTKK